MQKRKTKLYEYGIMTPDNAVIILLFYGFRRKKQKSVAGSLNLEIFE